MMIGASVVSFRDDRHYFLNIDLAFFRGLSLISNLIRTSRQELESDYRL
jgi:hypothetical protein